MESWETGATDACCRTNPTDPHEESQNNEKTCEDLTFDQRKFLPSWWCDGVFNPVRRTLQNHKTRKTNTSFHISCLTKQVLNHQDKSTMIADLIKNYALEKTQKKVVYNPVSHQDSANHAEQDGNLKRHEVSKIEDRVQCQKCLRYQRPGETFCTLCSHDTMHYRRGHEASRATNLQSIHHVRPWHSRFSTEEHPKGSTLWKIGRKAKTQKRKRLLGFRAQAQLRDDHGALPQ